MTRESSTLEMLVMLCFNRDQLGEEKVESVRKRIASFTNILVTAISRDVSIVINLAFDVLFTLISTIVVVCLLFLTTLFI